MADYDDLKDKRHSQARSSSRGGSAQNQRRTGNQFKRTSAGMLPPPKTAPPPVVMCKADGTAAAPLPFTAISDDSAAWAFHPHLPAVAPQAPVQARGEMGGPSIHEAAADRVVTGQSAAELCASIQMSPGVGQQTDAERIIDLISYGVVDWAVTTDEERQVVEILNSTTSVDAVISDISSAGMLNALINRVDDDSARRQMLQIFGRSLNSTNLALVMPLVRALDEQWEMQMMLGKHGVTSAAAAYTSSTHAGLIPSGDSEPFTGSGATGTNPTELSDIPMSDQALMAGGHNATKERYSNPLNPDYVNDPANNRYGEVFAMPDAYREGQAELLLRQEISTIYEESYAGQLPSRMQVVRAAGAAYNLEPELIGAFLLTEQRDQSANEDRVDYQSATSILSKNTSIGLGQVVVTTAQNNDLFSDLLSSATRTGLSHDQTAALLASDEFNIFAVAQYLRQVADEGARLAPTAAVLPDTFAEYPGIDFFAYANHSSTWPMDNRKAIASEYTSKAWDDRLVVLWGNLVELAYEDITRASIF